MGLRVYQTPKRLMVRRTVLSESRTEPAQKYVTPMTS